VEPTDIKEHDVTSRTDPPHGGTDSAPRTDPFCHPPFGLASSTPRRCSPWTVAERTVRPRCGFGPPRAVGNVCGNADTLLQGDYSYAKTVLSPWKGRAEVLENRLLFLSVD